MSARTTGGRMCGRAGEPAVRKGPWTLEEDLILVSYISQHGEGSWDNLARAAGLNRNGKSCRLRWLNYLRPGVRRGSITPEEDAVIRELHASLGNKWSKIATHLPGRTDNEVKNYWRTRIQKRPAPNTHQQQQSHRTPATTMAMTAASESTSSSSASASHDSSGAAVDFWCTKPDRLACYYAMVASDGVGASAASQSQASSAPGDFWYMQPNSDHGACCSQKTMTAAAVGLDSGSASLATMALGDGYKQTSYSYPCYSELSSAADGGVKMVDADCFWNAVDNFWGTLPVLDTTF